MLQFIQTVYGKVTVIAAAVATLWGLFKAIGALKAWCKKFWARYVDRRDAYKTTQEMLNKLCGKVDGIETELNKLSSELFQNSESTASMMLQKMMEAYHRYVLEENPIPLDVKTALCVMYDQYKVCGWHNHVPQDFKEKILACKTK